MPSLRALLFRNLIRTESRKMRRNVSIPALRRHMDRYGRYQRLAKDTTVERITFAGCVAEWITPANAVPGRTLLYLHGGAYVFGSCSTHRALVERLAKAVQARALLPEYRLAPEHPFPAALEDAKAIWQGLMEQGVRPAQCAVFGDSAGGGLAMALLVVARDAGMPLPAATVLLSPWADLECKGESIRTRAADEPWLRSEFLIPTADLYCGEHDADHPLISPIHADLRGLPPMLIHVGTHEILYDDATRLAARAQAQGTPTTLDVWDGLFHVFHIFSDFVPEATDAIQQIGAFVQQHMAEATSKATSLG